MADLAPVIPLVLGGLVSAPFAGYLGQDRPRQRWLMLMVGTLILLLSLRALLRLFGWL